MSGLPAASQNPFPSYTNTFIEVYRRLRNTNTARKWIDIELGPAQLGQGADALAKVHCLDRQQDSHLRRDLQHDFEAAKLRINLPGRRLEWPSTPVAASHIAAFLPLPDNSPSHGCSAPAVPQTRVQRTRFWADVSVEPCAALLALEARIDPFTFEDSAVPQPAPAGPPRLGRCRIPGDPTRYSSDRNLPNI